MTKTAKAALLTVGAIAIIGACSISTSSQAPDASTASAATSDASAPAAARSRTTPRPTPPPVPSEGTLTVPREVAPGTYSVTVPGDSFGCYWARLKGTSGQLEDVIANGLAQPGGHVTITVKPTDKAFTSTGCGTWHKTR